MAPTSTSNSSIAMALAGMTESVNIPKPRDNIWTGKDSYAAVTARSLPVPVKKPTSGLPTPPNSISPSLPPQAYKAPASPGPLTPPTAPPHVDSDIDLEDAVEHEKAQNSPQQRLTARDLHKLAESDSVGAITPSLLAKHHLPGILLDNGPLAIRYIMGYLTTSVPGFSGIPPAKARRLVVGALEGRNSDGSQGGLDGSVMFEKVGWGRWDARKRGQPSREAKEASQNHIPTNYLRIPITSSHFEDRALRPETSHDSRHLDSYVEEEADKMSFDDMDTNLSIPSKQLPEDVDMTDEEDWASIGAAGLRRQGSSYHLTGGLMPTNLRFPPHRDPRSRRRVGRERLAQSVPSSTGIMYNKSRQTQTAPTTLMGFASGSENGMASDARDREAVEALLSMSAV